jgi:DNA-binding response OmpR family regulator
VRLPSGCCPDLVDASAFRPAQQGRSNRQRLLILLRSRPFVTYTEAIDALWGDAKTGGPLYAHQIVATYVSRLRKAGHSIENCRGSGYRMLLYSAPKLKIAATRIGSSIAA